MIICLLMMVVWVGCDRVNEIRIKSALKKFEFRQHHLGMQVRIALFSEQEETAVEHARLAFAEIDRLDAIMSDYRIDSELNLLTTQALDTVKVVSRELFSVLARAQEIAAWSGGAFDITIGPLSQLWRKSRRLGNLPDSAQFLQAKKNTGWQKLVLYPKNRGVKLLQSGMKLDLGGIAKGYIAQAALHVLRNAGSPRALVEIGGEIAIGAPPPKQKGWAVVLPNDSEKPLHYLRDTVVATSGDTEQFVEFAGVRYSHILDPRSGLGLTTRISVTVLSEDGALADALSTTLSVLEAEGVQIATNRYKGILVYTKKVE